MPCCCDYHHHLHRPHWLHWIWPEPYPPYPGRYPPSPREDYVRGLEEERDLLEQRLRRLERELEELRKGSRSQQEQA